MGKVYEKVKEFKEKYPSTVAWRLKAHSKVIEKYLNPGEEVNFVFASQKGYSSFDIFSTFVVALTNKRILIAQKRLLFGYTYVAITPDMFNDLTVSTGIIWGKVHIDTVKETVILSNIAKAAMDDIETQITEYMMEEKKKYKLTQG
ncbi:MAG: PH domain-containing protein [Bacilli bacterium]|nr:PH domain-containing protein [Bacilli bacterium]